METDENGLYYMRARYYNTDIKRFINRDIIDGTIQNSQSLNKYSYVQGNPVSLTDPFGLCPDFSGILEYLKMVGHTLLDIAGFIPVVGFVADLANAYWYRCEGNPEMAMACAISAIPGAGDFIGAGLKGIGWAAKCQKLVKAADVVIDTSRFVGAVAQTELNVENFKLACASVAEEYKTTGKVSFWNGANLALSAIGVGVGAASIAGSARKLSSTNRNVNAKTSRGVLSDHLGVEEINSSEKFYALKNKNGGLVYVTRQEICVSDFENLVWDANGKAKVNIISGIHGNKTGYTQVDDSLYKFDKKYFDTANVYHYNELDALQCCDIINSPDITICAWCYSEYNSMVRMALQMK